MSLSLSDSPVAASAPVSDMDSAREFYEGTLGLVRASDHEPADNVRYACAGGTAIHVYLSQHAGGSGATLCGWGVPDLSAAVRELAGRGVVFEQYDLPGLVTDADGIADFGGGNRVAYFKDPDGNILSIAEVGPGNPV